MDRDGGTQETAAAMRMTKEKKKKKTSLNEMPLMW